jgi:hypothetical protein
MPQSSADLAKQFGGSPSSDLAKQFGGTADTPATPSAPDNPSWLDSVGSAIKGFVAGQPIHPVDMWNFATQAITHPKDTYLAMSQANMQVGKAADDAFQKGNYVEALRHAFNAQNPLAGAQIDAAGNKIQAGQTAEGLGEMAGITAGFAAPEIPKLVRAGAGAVAGAMQGTTIAERIAAGAERGSAARIVDVMAPKGASANVKRLGGMADKIAPQIAAEPGLAAGSRQGLATGVSGKLDEAATLLDEAHDAQNAGHAYPGAPIVKALEAKKQALMAEAVEGSQPTRVTSERASPILDAQGKPMTVTTETPQPIGQDVLPGPRAARAAQIDKAIAEVKQLGPIVRYDAIKNIRQAYDDVAKVKYAPSITADFLTKSGEASGAADVTGVLRDHLAELSPQTAAANARYSLFRKADDVMQAAQEIDRSKPKVGRQIMARMTGALVGSAIGVGSGSIEAASVGAGVGALLGPIADGVIAAGPTTKILTARALTSLSKALRTGNVASARIEFTKLKALGVTMGAAGRAAQQPDQPQPPAPTPDNTIAQGGIR